MRLEITAGPDLQMGRERLVLYQPEREDEMDLESMLKTVEKHLHPSGWVGKVLRETSLFWSHQTMASIWLSAYIVYLLPKREDWCLSTG